MAEISIGVPIYNGEERLEKVVANLLLLGRGRFKSRSGARFGVIALE